VAADSFDFFWSAEVPEHSVHVCGCRICKLDVVWAGDDVISCSRAAQEHRAPASRQNFMQTDPACIELHAPSMVLSRA
jgi:hypothetical protein